MPPATQRCPAFDHANCHLVRTGAGQMACPTVLLRGPGTCESQSATSALRRLFHRLKGRGKPGVGDR
jgi:hypothetical protein